MTRDDFKCPCCGANEISDDLVKRLQGIEVECHVKLHINSGFRCEKHNKEIRGEDASSHLVGLAADVSCNYSGLRMYLINYGLAAEIDRIGIGKSFIHFDIDTTKPRDVIWLY